jgi:signal transduction histidine kinase
MPIGHWVDTTDRAEKLVAAAEQGRLDPWLGAKAAAAVASETGHSQAQASYTLYVQACTRPRTLGLPPHVALDVQLQLLTALAPASDASLWEPVLSGQPAVIASVGNAAQTRRFRSAAAEALAGETVDGGRLQIRAVVVERFGAPAAALVVRSRADGRDRTSAFLRECAGVLAPLLERQALLARSAQRDQELHAASERRLRRLAFDLHDGPLQDLAALGADLQLARRQVAGVLDDPLRPVVLGRFDDLGARLQEIDETLRELSHSLESSSVVDRSLPEILGREVASLDRRMGIETSFAVTGVFDDLTASQRIALFRVAQEALSNVREHTDATEVQVTLERLTDGSRLVVRDNGRGFDVAQTVVGAARRGRLGLVGMNERVRLLGGTFGLVSEPGVGTEVTVTLPHWQPAAAAGAVDY